MAWVLARHGSDDISGVQVINHHIAMTVHTTTDAPLTPTSPSHSAHTAQLGRLEKISPTMRQHSSKQMYTKLLLRHSKSKTLAHIEFIPLASPVESSKIRATYAARLSNIFHRSRDDNNVSPLADSTSGQRPKHPHAFQAAPSPTELSRHLSAFTSRT